MKNTTRTWDKELESLMNMALELLAVIDSDSEWTIAEEDKLKRLTRITALLTKVTKIVGNGGYEEPNPDEDARIIANYLERINNPKP